MKIVTDVEVKECTPQYGANNIVRIVHNGVMENEDIVGQTFINNRGEKIIIGVSKSVQETIGLPINHFNDLRNDMERLRSSYKKAINDLISERVKNQVILEKIVFSTFFQRLKFLFTCNFELSFGCIKRK